MKRNLQLHEMCELYHVCSFIRQRQCAGFKQFFDRTGHKRALTWKSRQSSEEYLNMKKRRLTQPE